MINQVKSAIPIYAAVIATISLMVAIRAFRAAGPVLVVRAYFVKRVRGNMLLIVIDNHGRSAMTLDFVGFEYESWWGNKPKTIPHTLELSGPPLPYRLEGNSSMIWNVRDVKSVVVYREQAKADPDESFCVLVKSGMNRSYRSTITDIPEWAASWYRANADLLKVFEEEADPSIHDKDGASAES